MAAIYKSFSFPDPEISGNRRRSRLGASLPKRKASEAQPFATWFSVFGKHTFSELRISFLLNARLCDKLSDSGVKISMVGFK